MKKAENRKTHEQVAVKIVKHTHSQAILDREIEIMKRAATHPHILHLYDVYQTRKNIYLVMELAEGGEVFDHIVKHGEYSEQDASIVARKIVEAVKFLHDQGICHRDLKPQNLLCTGKTPTDIRIADFGLSKVFNEQTMMKTCLLCCLSFSFSFFDLPTPQIYKGCGSPEYVAPEILMCMAYDEAVDMWSIGIIIYILLTGCFPFWSENVQTLYQKIMNGAYRWPTRPEVSDSAKDLVRKLLEKNPKKRMTAAECLRHPWIMVRLLVFSPHCPESLLTFSHPAGAIGERTILVARLDRGTRGQTKDAKASTDHLRSFAHALQPQTNPQSRGR